MSPLSLQDVRSRRVVLGGPCLTKRRTRTPPRSEACVFGPGPHHRAPVSLPLGYLCSAEWGAPSVGSQPLHPHGRAGNPGEPCVTERLQACSLDPGWVVGPGRLGSWPGERASASGGRCATGTRLCQGRGQCAGTEQFPPPPHPFFLAEEQLIPSRGAAALLAGCLRSVTRT